MLRRPLIPTIAFCLIALIALPQLTTSAVQAHHSASPAPAQLAQDDPLPEMTGAAILDYVLTVDPYHAWGTWPTNDQNPDDYSGYLPASDAHGTAIRVFVNDIALDASAAPAFAGELPPGSMIVMENYDVTPQDPGALVALTIRVKYPDALATSDGWFWVKATPDGSAIAAEGAVPGCMNCHEQAATDYMMGYTFATSTNTAADSAAEINITASFTAPHIIKGMKECSSCHAEPTPLNPEIADTCVTCHTPPHKDISITTCTVCHMPHSTEGLTGAAVNEDADLDADDDHEDDRDD